ncbi:899_t:CDS:1, partial [Gigaspora rosea]
DLNVHKNQQKWETLPECVVLFMELLLDVKMELSMKNASEASKSKIENNVMMRKGANCGRLIVYNCNTKRG